VLHNARPFVGRYLYETENLRRPHIERQLQLTGNFQITQALQDTEFQQRSQRWSQLYDTGSWRYEESDADLDCHEASPPEAKTNVAKAHNRGGAAAAVPRGWQSFPERAASGFGPARTNSARLSAH
jgi:hypothetical protein